MNLKIKVKDETGFEELEKSFSRRLGAHLESKSQELKRRLLFRISSGIDIHGNQFAPYSPATIRQKLKKGQRISPVNLMDTGEMIGSISAKKTSDKSMELEINAKREIAGYLQEGTPNMPSREFFGVTDEDIDEIVIDGLLDFLD